MNCSINYYQIPFWRKLKSSEFQTEEISKSIYQKKRLRANIFGDFFHLKSIKILKTECDRNSNDNYLDVRILKGEPAKPGEFPWMVLVFWNIQFNSFNSIITIN